MEQRTQKNEKIPKWEENEIDKKISEIVNSILDASKFLEEDVNFISGLCSAKEHQENLVNLKANLGLKNILETLRKDKEKKNYSLKVSAMIGLGKLALNENNQKMFIREGYFEFVTSFITKEELNKEFIFVTLEAGYNIINSGNGMKRLFLIGNKLVQGLLDKETREKIGDFDLIRIILILLKKGIFSNEKISIPQFIFLNNHLEEDRRDVFLGKSFAMLISRTFDAISTAEQFSGTSYFESIIKKTIRKILSSKEMLKICEIGKIEFLGNNESYLGYKYFYLVYEAFRNTTKRICGNCKKQEDKNESLMCCSRCKNQLYCSRSCQVNDWKNHKLVCKK